MIYHDKISDQDLHTKLRAGEILLGGNNTAKIYGTLNCSQGKRLHRSNRVFFTSESEAREAGFRPCGHCMRTAYKQWKAENESL